MLSYILFVFLPTIKLMYANKEVQIYTITIQENSKFFFPILHLNSTMSVDIFIVRLLPFIDNRNYLFIRLTGYNWVESNRIPPI